MRTPKPDSRARFYMLPTTVGSSNHDMTRVSSPAYSFGSRLRVQDRPGPGPDTYDTSYLTRYGRPAVPSYVLGGRLCHGGWYPLSKGESPGPGAYSPELYGSIQWKCTVSKMSLRDSPPSSKHSLSDKSNSKPQNRAMSNSPGPGAYDVTPLDAYKTRSPGIKMAPSVTS